MNAGGLSNRVQFERRARFDDEYGNEQTDFVPFLTTWAQFRPQFGREQLEAGRLESTMAGTLTLRRSVYSAQITPEHRAVFKSGHYAGRIFNIVSIVPSPDGAGFDMTLMEGVAT
jgi:head-tail adaptor